MDEIYTATVLGLCANISRLGRLENPDGTATKHSKLCGATITADVKLRGDTITDYAHELEADALGKAAASYLAQHIIGKTVDEVQALRDTMRAMLKQNGTLPQGAWAGLSLFETMRDYPARQDSVLLPFETVVAAVEDAMNKIC